MSKINCGINTNLTQMQDIQCCDTYKELKRAIRDNDLAKVNILLSRGTNINAHDCSGGRVGGALLHLTNNAKIIKALLLHGANVHATIVNRETPLHAAMTNGSGLEVVRELIKHGASVHCRNRKSDTPLYLAIRQPYKNLEVIKELLENGADINYNNCVSTPLESSILYLECAKLLIKITLIRNFDKNYSEMIDLTPYKFYPTYNELSRYLEDCISEIVRMKTDMVNDNLSLYEFVISININTLHGSQKFAIPKILTSYPIYHDIISDKVKLCLELLTKLRHLQMYIKSNTPNLDVKEKEVILNFDCTYNVAKYLSNDDLTNFITVFYKPDQISENLVELSKQQDT